MSAIKLLPLATILSLAGCAALPFAPAVRPSAAEQGISKLISIRVAGFVKASGIT